MGHENRDVLFGLGHGLEPTQLRHHRRHVLLHPRRRLALHLHDVVHDPGGIDAVQDLSVGLQADEDHLRIRAVARRLDKYDAGRNRIVLRIVEDDESLERLGASLRCGRCGVLIMQSATPMVMMVFPASSEKFGTHSTPATWSAWWWVSTISRAFASARWSLANCSAK